MSRVMMLAVVFLMSSCRPVGPRAPASPVPASPPPEELAISGPYVHENLAVFLISKRGAPRGSEEYLTLDEALSTGTVRITECETGASVNELQIENLGVFPVYLQAGDTVKGGKQDRTIAADLILPPKGEKKVIPVFCVEPGRWAPRVSGEGSDRNVFTAAPVPLATREQNLAVRLEKDQARVWSAGKETNASLTTLAADFRPRDRNGNRAEIELSVSGLYGTDSYVLASEQPEIKTLTQPYLDAIASKTKGNQFLVGAAFAINGKINTAEVYETTGLFEKLWPRLLRGAAVEALAKKGGAGSPEVTVKDVRWLLEEPSKSEEKSESPLAGTELGVRRNSRVAQLSSRCNGSLVRRYWAKLD